MKFSILEDKSSTKKLNFILQAVSQSRMLRSDKLLPAAKVAGMSSSENKVFWKFLGDTVEEDLATELEKITNFTEFMESFAHYLLYQTNLDEQAYSEKINNLVGLFSQNYARL